MTTIPTFHTERLTFRAFREEDIVPMTAFYADEATARFVGGIEPPDRVWRRVASYLGHWHLRGYGIWALEERGDENAGRFAGYCGHWFPKGWPEREIAYGLMAYAQGRGLATEAAEAALSHAYGQLGWTTAISAVDVANVSSQRVAERIGAVREGEQRIGDFDAVIFRHRPPNGERGPNGGEAS